MSLSRYLLTVVIVPYSNEELFSSLKMRFYLCLYLFCAEFYLDSENESKRVGERKRTDWNSGRHRYSVKETQLS